MTDSIEPVCLMIPWEQTVEGAPGLRLDVALAHLTVAAITEGIDPYSVMRALHYRAEAIRCDLHRAEAINRGTDLGGGSFGGGLTGNQHFLQGFAP